MLEAKTHFILNILTRWSREVNNLPQTLQLVGEPGSGPKNLVQECILLNCFPKLFNTLLNEYMYYFPKVAVTKYHKLGLLKTTDLFYITVLEARSLTPRCQRGYILSQGPKEESILGFSLNFWGVTVNPWCPLVCHCITPISASICTWHASFCVCLCLFSYKDISHIDLGLKLIKYPLIFTCLYLKRSYLQIRSHS